MTLHLLATMFALASWSLSHMGPLTGVLAALTAAAIFGMARTGTIQNGYDILVPIAQGVPMQPLGTQTRITFAKIDPLVNGKEASVKRLLIRPSNKFQIVFVNGTKVQLDGMSLAQIIALFRLTFSPKSPQAVAGPSGSIIVDSLDGPRYAYMHAFFTGQLPFFIMKDVISEPTLQAAGGSDVLVGLDPCAWLDARENGGRRGGRPPQYCGPFGESNAHVGDVNWQESICFQHVFVRDEGDVDNDLDWAVPLREILGDPKGDCSGGGSGEIDITLGANGNLVDGMALSIVGANPTYDVFADCILHSSRHYSIPATAVYESYQEKNKQISLKPGITPLVVFLHQLDASGNMVPHNYTNVDLLQDGEIIQWSIVNDVMQFGFGLRRQSWEPTRDETNITTTQNARRFSRTGIPMTLRDKSILRMAGSLEKPLSLRVNQSTETLHDVVAIHLTPTTPARRAACLVWSGNDKDPAMKAVTLTDNSKHIDKARGSALPARVQDVGAQNQPTK